MLFPSKTETQGLTVVESLLSGTPVIGLNEMGVKNVIGKNQGGILTSENITEFSDAAKSLLLNDDLYDEYCTKALNRSKDFSADTLGQTLDNAYEQVITNHPKLAIKTSS